MNDVMSIAHDFSQVFLRDSAARMLGGSVNHKHTHSVGRARLALCCSSPASQQNGMLSLESASLVAKRVIEALDLKDFTLTVHDLGGSNPE